MKASQVMAAELTATDVMSTPVATVDDTSSLWHASDLMIRLGIHHIVVLAAGRDRCVGVLTDRDVLDAWYRGPAVIRNTPVRHLIASSTACVLPDATLREVSSVMIGNRVDAVPVVSEGGKLLGLVTAGDVVHAVATCIPVDNIAPTAVG